MNDAFRHLERLERELGEIAFQLTRVHFTHFGAADYWRPAINAYRCVDRFVIGVDLAGTDKAAIQVLAEPWRLIIRGTRPLSEPACDQPQPVQVLAMEIDYGPFERVLDLPAEVNPGHITAEHRNGLLCIYLPLRPHSARPRLSMNRPGHRIAACLGKAALKTHALQTLRDCRAPPNRAKRLECVRFIGAFRLARDGQRFMVPMHAEKRKGAP